MHGHLEFNFKPGSVLLCAISPQVDVVSENSTECSVSKNRDQRFSVARNAGDNRPAFSIKGVTDIRDREIPELQMLLQDTEDKLSQARSANNQTAVTAHEEKRTKLSEGVQGWQNILDYIQDVASKAESKQLAAVSGLMPDVLVESMVDRVWGKDLEQANKDVEQATAGMQQAQNLLMACLFSSGNCGNAQTNLNVAKTVLALAKSKQDNVTSLMERGRKNAADTNTISFTGQSLLINGGCHVFFTALILWIGPHWI